MVQPQKGSILNYDELALYFPWFPPKFLFEFQTEC